MHRSSTYLQFTQLYYSIRTISTILSRKDKVRILLSAVLIIVSSMLDVAAISTMYPFLVYALGSESSFSAIPFINFETFLNLFNGSLIVLSVIYISFIVFSFIFRVFILRQTGRYIAYASNNLACQVFERTIFGDQERASSQEIISNILLRCNYAMGVLINITNIFAAIVLIGGVFYTLIKVNATVTIIGSGSVAVCYLLMTKLTSKKSLSNGALIDKMSVLQLRHSNQCLGNLKNIVIEGRITNEIQYFRELDILVRLSRLSNHLINSIPRSAVETLIVTTIIVFVVYSSNYGIKVDGFLPLIGLYAIAFQRLLPSINSLFINYVNVLQSAESISQLANQIDDLGFKEDIEHRDYNVNSIELIDVSNQHKKTKQSLYKPICQFIAKGDKVIIRGKSGVGKSTFLESIIGLNLDYAGTIKVNTKDIRDENIRVWWNSLTYIPQTGYIFEGSVYYNITSLLDTETVDIEKYETAYRISRLPYENDLSKHKDIHIAENGGNLSGGEKQRLLLARALYRAKDVVFLDESLSALDPSLRRQILIDLIEQCRELTLFYVSHNTDDSKLFEKQITLDR